MGTVGGPRTAAINDKCDELIRKRLEGCQQDRGNLKGSMAKYAEYRGTVQGRMHGILAGSFFAFWGCSRSCATGKCCGRDRMEGYDEEGVPPVSFGESHFEEEVVDMKLETPGFNEKSSVAHPTVPVAARAAHQQGTPPPAPSPMRERPPPMVAPSMGGTELAGPALRVGPGGGGGSGGYGGNVVVAPGRGGMIER